MVENKRKIIKRISSIFIACASALMLCISPFLPKIQPKTMVASADFYQPPTWTNFAFPLIYSPPLATWGSGSSGLFGSSYFVRFTISTPETLYGTIYFSSIFMNDSNETFIQSFSDNEAAYESDSYGDYIELRNPSSLYEYGVSFLYHSGSGSYIPFLFNISDTFSSADTEIVSCFYKLSSVTFGSYNSYIKDYYPPFINCSTMSFSINFSSGNKIELIFPLFEYSGAFVEQNIIRQGLSYYAGNYTDGYKAGLAQGESTGYTDGYADGRSVGYNNGYNVGYQDGVNGASTYSFFNLISAVIDAPVQAFMDLFNFELLGVNLADFFLSLLTLSFIITLLRLFL